MPFSTRTLIAALASLLAAGAATPIRAAELDGFGPFDFGTAFERVEARHDLEMVDREGSEITARIGHAHTVIGYDFSVELVFDRGSLRDIWLSSRHDAASASDCHAHFENVFGALDAEYGPPDDTPVEDVDTVGADFKARFTVSQGRSIQLHTDYIAQSEYSDRACETFLTYRDRTGGSDTGF